MQVRCVADAVVVIPPGRAVAPGEVVDVPADVARRLVDAAVFERVGSSRKKS
jgi:hypothetical protein